MHSNLITIMLTLALIALYIYSANKRKRGIRIASGVNAYWETEEGKAILASRKESEIVCQRGNVVAMHVLKCAGTDQIVNIILSMTPSIEGSAGSDYYKKSAAEALAVIVDAIKYVDVKYDFYDLAMTMSSMEAAESLLSQLRLQNPNSQACLRLSSFLNQHGLCKGVGVDGRKPRLDMLGPATGRLLLALNHPLESRGVT